MASQAGVHVIAVAGAARRDYLTKLGAERVVDSKTEPLEESVSGAHVVLDLVGGETQERALGVLRRGGILVSAVSQVPESLQERYAVRAAYFIVEVTTARLNRISELFDAGKLVTDVGTVLALNDAARAHEMLSGLPHKHGKIVLSVT
jgi:NADPH:quinone reductase-like Zn-dependent oxidoreductase